MSRYPIHFTEAFNKVYCTIDTNERLWIDKIRKQLEENPTGKILKFSWLREKKYHNKRLYYIIDKNNKRVLFIAFTSKKDQQKTIKFIELNIRGFMEYLRGL